jgi:gliding motility-associated-like protein
MKEIFLNRKERKGVVKNAKLNPSIKTHCDLCEISLRSLRLIFLLIMIIFHISTSAQINCTTSPPLPPVLKSVSVQPESGNTEISWTLSSSPEIAAYIIYQYVDGAGINPDTIWDPTATSYTLTRAIANNYSASYVMTSTRIPTCTSKFSNVQNTIFEQTSIDTCNNKISVAWNSYSSVPRKVTGYSILVSVNGNSFTEAATFSSDMNKFTLSDFIINSEYCFVVRANLEDGTISNSNKSCLLTRMQKPPQWINTDQVTVNAQNKISLSYSVDPLSEISRFRLERKSGSSGLFKTISLPVASNGRVKFIDVEAHTDSINYYRLSAINNCANPVMVSDIGSNIVLSLEKTDNNLNFSWNSLKQIPEHTFSGKIYANPGTGFEQKASINQGDTTFTLAYSRIMYEITDKEVCFYISVSETSNLYGVREESQSSRVCTLPIEIITVPNVFTPNSGTVNAFFRPVLSFTPKKYQLVITNRQGKVLFETNDYLAVWDGILKGTPQAQDVFLWYLKVVTPSGKSISKTGTVTIINS